MNNKKEMRLEELMPLIKETLADGRSVSFSPHGISMLPMLRHGQDTVTLSPLPDRLKKYDLPLYQREDGKYILHRIVKAAKDYTCIGDNQFVYEEGISHSQMIAVVTEFTRTGKKHHINEPGYRLYCRFWHYSRPLRRLWRGALGRIKRSLKK